MAHALWSLTRVQRDSSDRMKLLVALVVGTLAFGAGCAKRDWIDRTLVTVDVSGVWQGRSSRGLGSTGMELTLQQQGPNVTGQVNLTPSQVLGAVGRIEGTVAGDVFRFHSLRAGELAGEVQVNGDEMTWLGHNAVWSGGAHPASPVAVAAEDDIPADSFASPTTGMPRTHSASSGTGIVSCRCQQQLTKRGGIAANRKG